MNPGLVVSMVICLSGTVLQRFGEVFLFRAESMEPLLHLRVLRLAQFGALLVNERWLLLVFPVCDEVCVGCHM